MNLSFETTDNYGCWCPQAWPRLLDCHREVLGGPTSFLPLGFVLLTPRLVSIDMRTQNVIPSSRCLHGKVNTATFVVVVSFVGHEVDAECERRH